MFLETRLQVSNAPPFTPTCHTVSACPGAGCARYTSSHGMPHAARQGRLHRVRHDRRRCRLCLGELPAILGRRATCQGRTPRHSRHHRHRVCAVCHHQARTLNFALDRVRGVSGKFEAAGGRTSGVLAADLEKHRPRGWAEHRVHQPLTDALYLGDHALVAQGAVGLGAVGATDDGEARVPAWGHWLGGAQKCRWPRGSTKASGAGRGGVASDWLQRVKTRNHASAPRFHLCAEPGNRPLAAQREKKSASSSLRHLCSEGGGGGGKATGEQGRFYLSAAAHCGVANIISALLASSDACHAMAIL